jgi:hypothetical protein
MIFFFILCNNYIYQLKERLIIIESLNNFFIILFPKSIAIKLFYFLFDLLILLLLLSAINLLNMDTLKYSIWNDEYNLELFTTLQILGLLILFYHFLIYDILVFHLLAFWLRGFRGILNLLQFCIKKFLRFYLIG